MNRPTRILNTCISTILRPHGDEDDIPDDEPQADWAGLESRIKEAGGSTDDDDTQESESAGEAGEQDAENKEASEQSEEADDANKGKEKKESKTEEEEDPDLKKFQPHPQASQETRTQFKALKAQTKAYKQERDTFKTELDTVKSELEKLKTDGVAAPEKDEEITALKAENEKLRQTAMVLDLEESEEFKTKYAAPVTKAEEDLHGLLKELHMPDWALKKVKEMGDSWPGWEDALGRLNDLDREDVLNARRALRNANREKQKAITNLRGADREKLITERTEKQKNETKTFWTGVGSKAQAMIDKEGQHMMLTKIPENATPEQKKTIEARNEILKTRNAEVSKLLGGAINMKDPEAAAALAFRAANSVFLKEQLDEATTKIKDLEKRLSEAEGKIGKGNKLGDAKGKPKTDARPVTETNFDESPEEAMDRERARYRA